MKNHLLPLAFFALALGSVPARADDLDVTTCVDGAVAPEMIRAMIQQESERQQVDPRLALAIADQESGFGRKVNSPAGARGPMQLMPATAARYEVVDICDAAQNIRGGVAFLKDLDRTFGGNIMLMVAAYNAGEERVLRSGGVPAIAETVSYTALVTNAYYGFDNSLKGGRRGREKGNSAARSTDIAVGVDLLTAGSIPEKPIPINQIKTESAAPSWIGGTVLYVQ